MSKLGYSILAATTIIAFLIGLVSQLQQGQKLSRQDYPPPVSFPLRNQDVVDPPVRAKFAVLIDLDSFYPLFKKEAFSAVPVASTTKMMTALVVAEKYNLDEEVTVSREATLQIGSDTKLLPGERLTVGSLLAALLIQSGNDAAYALAEHSGSVETFVSWMNAKAAALGMKATRFKDPSGLDDEGRSTAFDLAILAAVFLKNKTLVDIVVLPETTIYSVDRQHQHQLKNSNRLVTPEMYFPGTLGIKTGYTPQAGHTLVAAARKNGHTLISVILFTFDDTKEASAKESSKLLFWGFENHRWFSH
jgi:D-alanyl-D-alanine carboxypeptidase